MPTRRRAHAWPAAALLALLASAAGARAETPRLADPADLARPAFRVFSDVDGLPQNSVMAMAFDQRGYLWVGTQDGAAVSNGPSWRAVDMPEPDASNYVRAILAGADGALWFGTKDNGLVRLADGRWTRFSAGNGLPSASVWALAETEGSRGRVLWVGTDAGLARLEAGRWTVVDATSGLPDDRVRCLLETRTVEGGRALWVGTEGGLARYQDGTWTRWTRADGLPHPRVWSLLGTTAQDGMPVLWVGTYGGGLARLHRGRWEVFGRRAGLPSDLVRALAETVAPNGERSLWVGTDGGGLARLAGGRWRTFDTRSGLPSNGVAQLLPQPGPGPTAALWVGTYGGLARARLGRWLTLDVRSGQPENLAWSFLETRAPGRPPALWIGTYGDGLAVLENGTWTVRDTRRGLPNDTVWCLAPSRPRRAPPALWAATDGGLARFEGGRITVEDTRSGLPSDLVWSVLETVSADGRPVVWAGTFGGGVARLEDGRWTVFDKRSGLPDDRVPVLLETVAGSRRVLWAGTYTGGLARFEDGRWTAYDVRRGLPNNTVLSLAESDGPGGPTLWVGTLGGVARLDWTAPQPRWRVLSEHSEPALPNDTIYQIRHDRVGRTYLFTNRGVVRLTPGRGVSGAGPEFEMETFTTEDGLPANECNGGASIVDSRGRIWAGTVRGVAVLDPEQEVPDRRPKPLHVERTLLHGRAHPLEPNAKLVHDENSLAFEYVLVAHFRDADTRYRTQLVGLEDAPSDWTADRKREFAGLPAGEYVFRLWARDHAGNVSGPIERAFEIRPAPWRTWWARLLFAAGLVGLAVAITSAVSRARLARVLEMQRVRTGIATDLHDDIGASLTRIAILSEVVKSRLGDSRPELLPPLSQVAEASRDLVDTMSDIVWSIDPARDDLASLVRRILQFGSDLFEDRGVAWEPRVPVLADRVRLAPSQRRQLYLVLKEALSNAARHSGATRVSFSLRVEPGQIRAEVADDGRGIEGGLEAAAERSRGGHGLASMAERARQAGGSLVIDSSPGGGTRVQVEMPLVPPRSRSRA